jgi:hypothetical protein
MGSMVVGDFNFVRGFRFPVEADPPLVVDSDGVPAFEVSFQGFESVAGRDGEVIEFGDGMELCEFPESHTLDVWWKAAGFSLVEESFRVFTGEGSDHNVTR